MNMEHRYWRRRDVALEMRLFHRQRPLGRFSTSNISIDGLFLEAPWLEIAPNDIVDLQWDCGEMHRMKGLVIHRSDNGIGLLLIGSVPSAYLSRGSSDWGIGSLD